MTVAQPLNLTPLDFDQLMPISEAASILNTNEGHLRRVCREKLQARSLAFFAAASEAESPRWFIARSYDPRLAEVKDTGPLVPLMRCTGKQRADALARKACVDRFRNLKRSSSATIAQCVARIIEQSRRDFPSLNISRSLLYEWDKRYRREEDLIRLVDSRGGNRKHDAGADAWGAFKDLYLHPNQPSVAQCWKEVRRLAAENNWAWCSLRACRRQLDKRIPIQEQIKHREPRKFRNQLAPFIQQDPERWRAGETWIGDHKQLDVMCRHSNGSEIFRPWLTVWMDWRTRKITGWVMSDNPNSTTILAALRHGLKDESNNGGPRNVWIDNGKDYDAWLFHGQTKSQRRSRVALSVDEKRSGGILNMLGIEAHFATPYNPTGKARLERWFRTLEAFCKCFDTYTGNSTETKPERLNEILATPRAIPTFESVRERITNHIAGYNARADHSIDDLSEDGLTISPNEAFARWCDTKRVMADPAAMDHLLMNWHKPLSVGRNGIALPVCGRPVHYGQFEPSLAEFKAASKADRRLVNVAFDPHDLRSIRVFDESFRFICTAQINDIAAARGDAISVKNVAELNRKKARYKRATRDVAEHALSSILTNEEQLATIAANEHRPKPASPPAAMQIIQTPIDGQAAELKRDELRKAVGAEGALSSTGKRLRSISDLHGKIQPRQRVAAGADPLAKLRERNHEW